MKEKCFYSIAGIVDRTRSCAPSFGQNLKLQKDRNEAASAISAPCFTDHMVTMWTTVTRQKTVLWWYLLQKFKMKCMWVSHSIYTHTFLGLFCSRLQLISTWPLTQRIKAKKEDKERALLLSHVKVSQAKIGCFSSHPCGSPHHRGYPATLSADTHFPINEIMFNLSHTAT